MQSFKTFFLIVALASLSVNTNGQNPIKNYEKEWKKVEGFVKKNLPKSALIEVRKIYNLAKKDGSTDSPQDAQIIKALVYMTGLQQENREDNEVLSINEIEKESTTSKEPVTSILNSLLAGIYWNYYQQHRWQFYNRTQTTPIDIGGKKDDITTW